VGASALNRVRCPAHERGREHRDVPQDFVGSLAITPTPDV
jgi:hypothetical protein